MAMFQSAARPAGRVHVEFKAGKMDWNGKVVTADKNKGKIVLFTSTEDELMHFQWWDREKNEATLDLILLNDAYFVKVDKCKTGRVYLLVFTSSNKKLFFWMQEPKEDGDADLINKFNKVVGCEIPKQKAGGIASAASAPQPAVVEAGSAAAVGGASGDVDPQLRAILQQFLEAQGHSSRPGAMEGAAGGFGQRPPPVPLGAVLTTEVLTSLLSDQEACKEMASLLPLGQQDNQDLREALTSPQLQQHLQSLSQAVHSDQLPVLFASLGLNPNAISSAWGADALETLCRAMEAKESGS